MSDAIRCKSPGCRSWCYGGRIYCRTCRLAANMRQQRSREARRTGLAAATDVSRNVVALNPDPCLDTPAFDRVADSGASTHYPRLKQPR